MMFQWFAVQEDPSMSASPVLGSSQKHFWSSVPGYSDVERKYLHHPSTIRHTEIRVYNIILYKSIQIYQMCLFVIDYIIKCEIMWVYRSVGKKVDWKGTNAWPHTPWAALLMDESPRSPVSLQSPKMWFHVPTVQVSIQHHELDS